MDLHVIKENILADDIAKAVPPVLSAKKQVHAQTPRQPLMDLKQLGRPVDGVGPCKTVCGGKLQTPICTPKAKKSNRKIKPASLVYQEERKESTKNKVTLDDISPQTCEEAQVDMTTIPEEPINEFVTQVLNRCVHDLQNEKCQPDGTSSCVSITADEVLESPVTYASEDSLLSDSMSGADISLTDSTKTEDELLASYCQTPSINLQIKDNETQASKKSPELESVREMEIRKSTPRPTFLEKVALTRRVREATASVGSWVVDRDQRDLHLHSEKDYSKPKLVHDVGCSPFPVNQQISLIMVETNSSSCTASITNHDTNQKRGEESNGTTKESSCESQAVSETGSCIEEDICNTCDSALVDHHNRLTDNMSEAIDSTDSVQNSNNVVHGRVSIGCSPLVSAYSDSTTQSTPRPVNKEIGVQSEIINKSVMCSPIPLSVCDTSAQYDVETQSMMCSPIRFSACDTSVQNVAETQSVMCSPMLIPVCDMAVQQETETQSIMCSPIRIPVHDTSVQNVAEMQSVFCSPMVPCPSHDKSVLVSGPELVDATVGTEPVMSHDQSVSVAPDMCTVATEMDDLPMTNAGTSMTPVKLPKNKQGKKLTADDIRKQHPRVLANHLDTLTMEKARLEGLVKNLEKQAKKLVAQEEIVKELEKTKRSLDELQRKYEEDIAEHQNKEEKLGAELAATKLEHDKEILKLKQEYEDTDYRDHFLASQKLVSELQADLEQYNMLVDDIDQSQKLQLELEEVISESWSKVKTAGQKITTMKQKLDEQVVVLSKQKQENKDELDFLEEQKSVLQSERQEMVDMVLVCKENMTELESKLSQTEEELKASLDRMKSLESDLTNNNKENEDLNTLNVELSQSVDELKQKEETLTAEIQELQTKLSETETNLQDVNKRLSDTLECKETEAAEFKKSKEKTSLAIINLQRTLEMREQDIDSLEKDLFECREIIYTQLEANKTLETHHKAAATELKAVKTENLSLRDCCAVLRGKEQELKSILESVQDELEGTKNMATRIIKKQGTEIADCFTSLGELTDGMATILENLNRRAGIQMVGLNASLGSAIDELSELRNSQVTLTANNTSLNQSSLVSQILKAAKSVETAKETANGTTAQNSNINGQTSTGSNSVQKEEQNQSESKNQSGNSQSQNCEKKLVKQSEKSEKSKNRHSTLNADLLKCNSKSSAVILGSENWVLNKDKENSLLAQVDKMSSLFNEIMRVTNLLEKALKSSLSDVKGENDDLNCRMFQCEYAERRLHAELEMCQKELVTSEATIKQLQATIEEMGDRYGRVLDNQTEIKQQQLEIRNLRGKVQSIEGEKELLNEQISELLQQIETQSGGGEDSSEMVVLRREVLKYQQKVERYRTEQMKTDARMEELSAKAARRIQKLEDNWKKADSEVCRLDDLVDVVRRNLVSCEMYRRDERLQKLVNMIDGVEPPKSCKKKLES